MPFGVFLDVGVEGVLGLVRITEFCLPPKRMTPDDYPQIGSELEARVLAFDDRNRQVQLTLIPEPPYLLDPTAFDGTRLLAIWDWLLPPGCRLLALTKLGDLFILAPGSQVLWLDLIEGGVVEVAASPMDFQAKALEPEYADDWFLPGFVEGAEERGFSLGPGECYAFKVHPKIGGELASSNLTPMNLVAYHSVCSELHKLPPGSSVGGFTVDGEKP